MGPWARSKGTAGITGFLPSRLGLPKVPFHSPESPTLALSPPRLLFPRQSCSYRVTQDKFLSALGLFPHGKVRGMALSEDLFTTNNL